MKNQKGITLVALVITIIVMLILVGVTVNVALTGGLFDTAKKAKTQTIEEQEREQLMSIVLGKYNTETDTIEIAESELPEGWTKSDEVYVSPKGNKFTVTEDRIVEKYEVPWYNLTDEEKTEILNAGAAEVDEDGNGGYIIATVDEEDYQYTIAVSSTGNGRVVMIQLGKAGIDANHPDEFAAASGLIYITDEEVAEAYRQIIPYFQTYTWYYAPVASHFGEEGTGEFSGDINEWIPESGIICQSYVDRMIENFNK